MRGSYVFRFSFKFIYELLKSKEGRTFLRLCWQCGDKKRYSKGEVKLEGKKFTFVDNMSFLWQYWEIFHKRYYFFESTSKEPVILDCGANIGMASFFFLKNYPNCKITAFEPDPHIAEIFEQNVGAEILIKKAVWISDEGVTMQQEGSDAGFITSEGGAIVESTSLKEELRKFEKIDFLKIDIEGAEHEVIPHCKDELKRVQNLFLEYHDHNDASQLGKILSIIEEMGFRYVISNEDHYLRSPYLKVKDRNLQVNIFATRKF